MTQIVDGSVTGSITVTASDTADLVFPSGTNRTRGVLVGVSGNLNVIMADGTTALLKAVTAGVVHPLSVKRIKATSTTATDIVALY